MSYDKMFNRVFIESKTEDDEALFAIRNGKYLSCGFIIKDTITGKYLGCHPTGNNSGKFDIPKGHMDKGETELETATRELKEETGIELTGSENIIDLGRFEYKRDKDLYLFYLELPIDINKLNCTSMFTDSTGARHPEMDGYVLLDNFDHYFFGLRDILKKVA